MTEKDCFESLIRKTIKDYNSSKDFARIQGFILSIRLIDSYKMKLLERYRQFYPKNPSYIARKIGFRDIILPEDVRNDFYLTIVSGEFHSKGNKKSERNIEVTVKIFNENGQILNNCFNVDSLSSMSSIYRSTVYYHEDKPRWMEILKISLPIEKYANAHLRFLFKHRSSNESKDKNEKPFAMSYINLMNTDGTTLKNNYYRLFVWKIDQKRYTESDLNYLQLPSSERDLDRLEQIDSPDYRQQILKRQKSTSIFSLNLKDGFIIKTVICSTKLAQNIKILSLLKWKEKTDSLNEILENINKLDGEEIMKFLHDVLDALFEIWMDPTISINFDRKIFDVLVHIIKHLLQEKYIHFQEILDDYIEKHFSATLIYPKLIECFKYYVENPECQTSYQTIVCMEFIFKLIIKSRDLYSLLNNGKNRIEFESDLDDLFEQFIKLMDMNENYPIDRDQQEPQPQPQQQRQRSSSTISAAPITPTTSNLIKVKLGVMKYFPKIIPIVLRLFDERSLTLRVIQLLSSNTEKEMRTSSNSVQTLACIHEIVESDLYRSYPECRRKLLPIINIHLHNVLTRMMIDEILVQSEKLDKCLSIITDSLEILIQKDSRAIKYDIYDFVQFLLQTMIEFFHFLREKNYNDFNLIRLWSLILTILYQMTDYHCLEFFNRLKNNDELRPFLMDLLKTFDSCTERSLFPRDWYDMNLTQNMYVSID